MTESKDVPLLNQTMDLTLQTLEILKRVPKFDRYIVGEKISSITLELLADVGAVVGSTPPSIKVTLLQKITADVSRLLILWRLASQTKIIPVSKHAIVMAFLIEISTQAQALGRWHEAKLKA